LPLSGRVRRPQRGVPAARLGYAVTILEKSPKAAGSIAAGFRLVLPAHVLDREIERLVELGITIKTNVEIGKDVSWDDLKKNYDAVVLAVGLIESNSARAEGENKDGVIFGLPFLRDTAWARQWSSWAHALLSSAEETPRSTAPVKRCRQGPWSDHDHGRGRPQRDASRAGRSARQVEEGVELLHGRAMTAVLGNGKVEALQLHPARFAGAINASPIVIDREAKAERFAADNVIIAVGQRASLGWLPDEFKTERGTIRTDKFGRLGNTNIFAAGDVVQLVWGSRWMVVNAVGDGKRVAFNLDKVLRGEALQPGRFPLT